MARVACPACGKGRDINELQADVRNLLGHMRGALARNPNSKAFAAQVELLERIQHQLATTYKQRLALQTLFVTGRKRKCGLCNSSGSIDL